MSNINEQINTQREVAALGKNPLVSQLASKRVYDEAVRNLDHLDKRPKVNFSRVLNTDQARYVTEAYPEFSVNFGNCANSVHTLAGGLRTLELEYLMMQVPFGSPCFDIGGNFSAHMMKGRPYVHCCNPMLDIKDVARVTMYHDSIYRYCNRVTGHARCRINDAEGPDGNRGRLGDLRPLPSFQYPAFKLYSDNVSALTCSDIFQECTYEHGTGGKRYAISLHSLYDVPYEDIGPALERKNVEVLYAAMHFSEELLLGYERGDMNEIGAFFTNNGDDRISFAFGDESTLHYEHSFSNLKKIITRTYFPASESCVYIKEFMVKRVNTFFFRIVRVNTHLLHKSVCQHGVNPVNKNDYFALKSSPIFQDKATFSVWFPQAKNKVVIPVFRKDSFLTGKVSVSKLLIDSNFVYTIYNHICTYDNKALSWKNVQSFVESIRSRMVVNGVSVRNEWNIPVDQLVDISFTLFMLVLVKKAEVEYMTGKLMGGSGTLWQRFSNVLLAGFECVTDSLKEALYATGWFVSLGDELRIETPDLFMTFSDYISGVFEADARIESAKIADVLDSTDTLHQRVSDLCERYDGLQFDVEKFSHFCEKFDVSPELMSHVIEAIFSAECGITISGAGLGSTEADAAAAISPLPVDMCVDLMDETDDTEEEEKILIKANKDCKLSYDEYRYAEILVNSPSSSTVRPLPASGLVKYFTNNGMTLPKMWVEKNSVNLPQRGLSVRKNTHEIPPLDEETVVLNKIHFKKVSDMRLKQSITPVLYTGPIRVRQMNNFLDYLSASLGATINNLERLVLSSHTGKGETMQTYGLYDCVKEEWILVPNDKKHQWAIVLAGDGTTRVILVKYDDQDRPIVEKGKWIRFAVCSDTKVYSTIRVLEVLSTQEPIEPTASVVLVDGVPGCGKTAEIIQRVNWKTDLVLTPGREAAQMIRRRANYKTRGCVATNDNVRTFDSFVMKPGVFQFETLWVDEGLMVHTGMLNFAINLCGCKTAYVFGDKKQIPFINRVTNFDYPDDLAKLVVDRIEKRHVTKRCPRDVTRFLNDIYGAAITTASTVAHSVSTKMLAGVGIVRPELTKLPGKIITFTQSDKYTLEKAGYEDVNTVHEIQGETYPHVSLVRVTATPIHLINRKSPHVLVALSRHTESFVYYTLVADCITSIVSDLEKVDTSILSMYACVSGSK